MKKKFNVFDQIRQAIDNSVDGIVDLRNIKIKSKSTVYNTFSNYSKKISDYEVLWPKGFQPRVYRKGKRKENKTLTEKYSDMIKENKQLKDHLAKLYDILVLNFRILMSMKGKCCKCGNICQITRSVTGELIYICDKCHEIHIYDTKKYDILISLK